MPTRSKHRLKYCWSAHCNMLSIMHTDLLPCVWWGLYGTSPTRPKVLLVACGGGVYDKMHYFKSDEARWTAGRRPGWRGCLLHQPSAGCHSGGTPPRYGLQPPPTHPVHHLRQWLQQAAQRHPQHLQHRWSCSCSGLAAAVLGTVSRLQPVSGPSVPAASAPGEALCAASPVLLHGCVPAPACCTC